MRPSRVKITKTDVRSKNMSFGSSEGRVFSEGCAGGVWTKGRGNREGGIKRYERERGIEKTGG